MTEEHINEATYPSHRDQHKLYSLRSRQEHQMHEENDIRYQRRPAEHSPDIL